MALSKIQEDILRRLQRSTRGLSTRDVARSLNVSPAVIGRELLDLQKAGWVASERQRWKLLRKLEATGHEAPAAPPTTSPPVQLGSSARSVPSPRTAVIDRGKSRWRDFRNLCEYYAECVRLDQRVTVHAKAEDEGTGFVCLSGQLPQTDSFRISIPQAWHLWAREASKHQYLFLGYPLSRFQWRDSSAGKDVVFLSPVFMVPCRFELRGLDLTVETLGNIRINEGWLERRLKNLDDRRAFTQLCGGTEADDSISYGEPLGSWSEVAQLLRHYYPDWLEEPLNPRALGALPAISQVAKNGIYNRAGLLLPRTWKYTKRLHHELLQLANERPDDELDQSALRYLFPHTPSNSSGGGHAYPSEDSAPVIGGAVLPALNREQSQAAMAAAEQKLSIVVGPPGTGKSRVVQAVLTQQTLSGANAIFASRNHQALDAVVPRINAMTDPWPSILRLAQRDWNTYDPGLLAAIRELVAIGGHPADEIDPESLDVIRQKVARKRQVQGTLQEIRDLRSKLFGVLTRIDELVGDSLGESTPSEREETLARHHQSLQLPTTNHVDQALAALRKVQQKKPLWEVVLDFLWRRDRAIEAEQAARSIDAKYRQWLDPQGKAAPAPSHSDAATRQYFSQVLEYLRPLSVLSDKLSESSQLRTELSELPDLVTLLSDDLRLSQEIESRCRNLLQAKAQAVGAGLTEEERTKLAQVHAAAQNQSGLDSEADEQRIARALQRVFPILLQHYPLAATTNLSVGRDIPLQAGLYDLLVLDESSQCDIASVIPLLFRSRRALVVGDPMQLSHVTTLSAATDKHLRKQFQLGAIELERFSYRSISMFDLAASSPDVGARTSLRQHHRCHPEIAEYCSETFYKGTLTTLTSHEADGGLKWTHVDDDCQAVTGGGVISSAQIEAVVTELKGLAETGFVKTVGVVTPFRKQADRIRDRLFQELPPETIRKWRLLVNTADGFQGDERDLILMSLPGGANLPDGSRRFLAAGPNRFNVAVSRARWLLHVFGDTHWARDCGIQHIALLQQSCDRSEQARQAEEDRGIRFDLMGPVWEPLLAERLRAAGIEFQQQYPTCGRYLDFAILEQSFKLNVEVDGEAYHRSASGERLAADLDRDQLLMAHGWTVLRFWVYELREDFEGCLEKIRKTIQQLGTIPGGKT